MDCKKYYEEKIVYFNDSIFITDNFDELGAIRGHIYKRSFRAPEHNRWCDSISVDLSLRDCSETISWDFSVSADPVRNGRYLKKLDNIIEFITKFRTALMQAQIQAEHFGKELELKRPSNTSFEDFLEDLKK